MKNHFLFAYAGNKRSEVDNIHNYIKNTLNDDIKYIIEPFCGTCALSYYISTLYPKKFVYVLNDFDKNLIELLQIVKDEYKFQKFIDDLNEIHANIWTKEDYNKLRNNKSLLIYVYYHKCYSIRPGLYPNNGRFDNYDFNRLHESPIIKFLRNEKIIFTNNDGIETYKKYKNKSDALIFIDPPYILSCNSLYSKQTTNIYEYLDENDINDEKAKICICLEGNFITKLLFKKYIVDTYDKLYNGSKKHTTHFIAINNKIT